MRRTLARLALLVGATFVVVLAVALYYRVGWTQMENQCPSGGPTARRADDGVSYTWSWQPLGFTCTYGDGSSDTSLWRA